MKTVTLVPLRIGDNVRRQFLWDMTKPVLEELGYPLFIGEPNTRHWSRAQAINNAAKAADDWEVAVIGDGDTIPDMGSIRRAIAWVSDTRGAAKPHDYRRNLNKQGTLVFLRRGYSALEPRHFEKPWAGGGMLVVHRDAWERVGGFDERFIGWGHEDSAFNLACLKHARFDRLPGDVLHLWHEQETASHESRQRYRLLLRQYRGDIEEWSRDKGYANPSQLF